MYIYIQYTYASENVYRMYMYMRLYVHQTYTAMRLYAITATHCNTLQHTATWDYMRLYTWDYMRLYVHQTYTANPTWGVIFESSTLKARTSLLPRFDEKRRSSFELWALKQHSKMSPQVGLAVPQIHVFWCRCIGCIRLMYIYSDVHQSRRQQSWQAKSLYTSMCTTYIHIQMYIHIHTSESEATVLAGKELGGKTHVYMRMYVYICTYMSVEGDFLGKQRAGVWNSCMYEYVYVHTYGWRRQCWQSKELGSETHVCMNTYMYIHTYIWSQATVLAGKSCVIKLMYLWICMYIHTCTGSDATVLAGKELGVKTLAYYPLAMGLLTGKLHPERFRGKGDPRWVGGWEWVGGGLCGVGGVGGFVCTSNKLLYLFFIYIERFTCVTWLFHMHDMTHSNVWRDSIMSARPNEWFIFPYW